MKSTSLSLVDPTCCFQKSFWGIYKWLVPCCQDRDPVHGGGGSQHQHRATHELGTTILAFHCHAVTSRRDHQSPSPAGFCRSGLPFHPPPSPGLPSEFSDSSHAISTHRLFMFSSHQNHFRLRLYPRFLPHGPFPH